MTDEQLPGEAGADEATSETSVDWEQRYKDTHSNWNQLNERMSRFEKDPAALIEFIQEKHPDLLADEDEEEDTEGLTYEDDDPTAAELATLRQKQEQFEEWQAQQVAKEGEALFNKDLAEIAGDRKISRQGRDWIGLQVSRGGNNREALEAAAREWFEFEDSFAPKQPKPRVPHVPSAGQAATDVPNWDDMTPGEINRYLAERVRAEEAQT